MPDLSAKQLGAVNNLLQRMCPSLGLALLEQLNCETALDLLTVQSVTLAELLSRSGSALQTQFTFSQPEGSDSVFVITEDAARVLVTLMDGQPASDPSQELTDPQIDSLSNGMSGLVRAFAAVLTNLTGDNFELESSSTQIGILTVPPVFALEGIAIEARFSLSVPGVIETELSALFTTTLMLDVIPSIEIALNPVPVDTDSILSEDEVAVMLSQVGGGGADFGQPISPSLSAMGLDTEASNPFSNMPGTGSDFAPHRGLDMILDIPLDVTVELGRVRMLIKDVLDLSSGSIIELDRVAGEPVDLLVNGRLVAKGEVVVIEDNFGIRITEITSPADRVAGLGKGR